MDGKTTLFDVATGLDLGPDAEGLRQRATSHKSDGELARQAVARRKLEILREERWLQSMLHDVYDEPGRRI
jgi:hypothetical protein